MKKLFAVSTIVMTVFVAVAAPRTASAEDAAADPTACEQAYDGAAQGLCIAYCEARDCNMVLKTDPNDAVCNRIRGKFQALTGIDLAGGCPQTKIIK